MQPETFIAPSFAQLESDVLLRVPFRIKRGKDGSIEIFLLIEHQSEPDDLMLFRVVRYVVSIYERQATEWLQTHRNLRKFRFSPVLPIVFYSGTRTWDELKPKAELVQEGKRFATRLPTLEPEFVNLSTTGTGVLQTKTGLFGWVLWLIQQKRQKQAGFSDVLRQVATRVHKLHDTKVGRWDSLLSFMHAMIYHDRETAEHEALVEILRSTARKDYQPEVILMGKTIAQELREEGKHEGEIEGMRKSLVRLLTKKFKGIPENILAEIQATTDNQQLESWLDAVLTARQITDIPFRGQP